MPYLAHVKYQQRETQEKTRRRSTVMLNLEITMSHHAKLLDGLATVCVTSLRPLATYRLMNTKVKTITSSHTAEHQDVLAPLHLLVVVRVLV